MKKIVHLFLAVWLCFAAVPADAAPRRAKNVILFLADAGGVATVHGASLFGYNAPQSLFIQSWDNIGLSDTTPLSSWVSDSAAGMTAIVTGQKTHNGVISQGADTVRGSKDGKSLKTILEYAEEHGLSTGVLSNVTITDATPAACFAHTNDRKNHAIIFEQLLSPAYGDGVDVLIGPGRTSIFKAVREAGKDPDQLASSKGRKVHSALADIPTDANKALVILDGDFSLADASLQALSMLSRNEKGFFLMIESDAHTNKPLLGLSRLVAFDKLIREIASKVDLNDTLLIFTADHSFDFRVKSGSSGEPLLKGLDEAVGATKEAPLRLAHVNVDNAHTGEQVVVAAKGPGAELVHGYMLNTDIFRVMLNAFGWNANSAPTTK
jgi:alkaline phosphatase